MQEKHIDHDHNKASDNSAAEPKDTGKLKQFLSIVGVAFAAIAVLVIAYLGYLYVATPLSIREPLYEHYHFRMSLNVDGKELNFADKAYQEGYSKDNCNAELTAHPIHFHDERNHFVHIHWEGMTGGQILKYYGWNYIGGIKGSLGHRFDSGIPPKKVPIHGNILPAKPDGDTFYVYSGNSKAYSVRTFKDFTSQDLEKFFNKESNSPSHKLNQEKRSSMIDTFIDKLQPTAYAHGTEEHTDEGQSELSGEQLERLNNLIGDVVIIVQKEKPSDAQIKQRFDALTPLGESTCAG